MWIVVKLVCLALCVLALCAGAVYLPRLQATPGEIAMLRLAECALPCWIGIIPGKTTIGEARRLAQKTYDAADFDVQGTETGGSYSLTYVLKIAAKRAPQYLLVSLLGAGAAKQLDSSMVYEIRIYPYADPDSEGYVPTVADLMLALGKPECLGVHWGSYTAWPLLLYPQYQAAISVGTTSLQVSPYQSAGLFLSDQPFICSLNDLAWRGFTDYQAPLLDTMRP